MEHDGRKTTYAKLKKKFMHTLVGVSTESAHVIKKQQGKMKKIKQSRTSFFFYFNITFVSLQYLQAFMDSYFFFKQSKSVSPHFISPWSGMVSPAVRLV